jgi:predicted Zn-dependent peptidase
MRVETLLREARMATEAARRSGQPKEYQFTLEQNGATDLVSGAAYDSTVLAYSLPSNRMELWFLMESQRLLRPAFRDFYEERDSVPEKTARQVAQNPQNELLWELLAAAFKEHPYRNPVEGWPADVRNLRRKQAREYFEKYYVPANITIAIAGDVNPAEARRMAERYFGPMPAKPMPPQVHQEEPAQNGPKTVVLESTRAMLAVGYKRPNQYDKDDLAFDVMQFLLYQSNAGYLYQELVQQKHMAAGVAATSTYPGGRFPNLAVFVLAPAQGHTIEEEVLTRFKAQPVDQQSLNRAKAQIRGTLLRRLANNNAMSSLLAEYSSMYGDWRKMFTAVDDLSNVTPEAVQRVAAKYLVATGRTTVYTVAPGQSNFVQDRPAERKAGEPR